MENGAKTDLDDDDDDHGDDDDDDLDCLKDEAGIDQIVADVKKKYKKQKSLVEFHSWEIIKKLKKPDNYVPVTNGQVGWSGRVISFVEIFSSALSDFVLPGLGPSNGEIKGERKDFHGPLSR